MAQRTGLAGSCLSRLPVLLIDHDVKWVSTRLGIRSRITCELVALAFAFTSCLGHAAASSQALQRDPYAGFVTDNTITFVGQEFYRAFNSRWRDLGLSDRYTLGIFERPSARWGSLVWVEFDQQRMFTSYLSPARRDAVRQTAEQAAQIVHQKVLDSEVRSALFKDPDLGKSDF